MLHFHWKDRSSLVFQMLQNGKFYLIFFNRHRNKNYLPLNFFKNIALSHFCTGLDPLLFHVSSPFDQNIWFQLRSHILQTQGILWTNTLPLLPCHGWCLLNQLCSSPWPHILANHPHDKVRSGSSSCQPQAVGPSFLSSKLCEVMQGWGLQIFIDWSVEV